ncbi:hypothetical protein ASPZODRAFT_137565 [Penicilliopsis zonata CBS 506.65]|uniref:Transcriptional coactivator p15 (PC4) C-terminal domain-containing protein n=1 Tax=Penicilliopsis zonata CBS 506.65 TaxID=1073090 RepID=A0A1L9S4D0_9EURO|nr:hypothetical protein ASPZODRAFT_137565 [Penicilliopsis zonata CBS 506.65]OJJ42022.1 hypothetical protein ASPZODRAFT_137565 [Penicilliopsis zonata CBS 506.65]
MDHYEPQRRTKRIKLQDRNQNQHDNSAEPVSCPLRKMDSNGDIFWEIAKSRRLTLSTFRGQTLLSIREYYTKDGQELPGKKGISLPVDQFSSLVSLLPDVEVILREKGQTIPRPEYGRTSAAVHDDENKPRSKVGLEEPQSSKANIEVTSDEDEEGDA